VSFYSCIDIFFPYFQSFRIESWVAQISIEALIQTKSFWANKTRVPEEELSCVAIEDVDGRLDVELDDDEAVGHLQT